MDKELKVQKFRLKKMQKRIEDATEKKELDFIQDELRILESEIDKIADSTLRGAYLKRLRAITTRHEVWKLRDEVATLKLDIVDKKDVIQQKKDEIEERDFKEKLFLKDLEDLEESKDLFLKQIEDAIQESLMIQKKAARDIEVIENVQIVKKHPSVLLETLSLVYLAKSNMDKKLKLPLMLALVTDICDKLQIEDEKKITYEYKYEDISAIIDKSLDSVSDLQKSMEDALLDIQDMQKDYLKEFANFKHLKEFQDLFDMLDTVSKTIEVELGTVDDVLYDLGKSLDENNEKVLKLDSM